MTKPLPFQSRNKFTKEEIVEQVPFAQTFAGYFTRRDKTKNGEKQFYLYSSDWENLILSGIASFGKQFKISTSALEPHFQENSEFFITQSSLAGHTYTYYKPDGKPSVNITMQAIGEKTKLSRGVVVRVYDKEGNLIESPEDELITQRQPKLEGGVYVLRFPLFGGKGSEKNMILDYKGQYCFVFEKLEDDEFYMAVRYPLSIANGFAIGLSLMKKFLSE